MKYVTFLLILLTGCSVISKEIRQEVDRTIALPMVQAASYAFEGKKVIWGGVIISSKNLADKSTIEVLQTPLDRNDRVTDRELSKGRFIIESTAYLDTVIYREGKEITVAGIIKGVIIQKIGERDYSYPVLEPLEMHVYEPYKEPVYEPVPPWWYFPPYNPYYPHYPYPYRYYPPYYIPR